MVIVSVVSRMVLMVVLLLLRGDGDGGGRGNGLGAAGDFSPASPLLRGHHGPRICRLRPRHYLFLSSVWRSGESRVLAFSFRFRPPTHSAYTRLVLSRENCF